MADFYFFTEPDKIVQNQNQQYGPLDSSEYRVTSTISPISGMSKIPVYAAFNSSIVVLDQVDPLTNKPHPDYVNIVLVPIVKSQTELQPSLEYMIYRGLRREDFMQFNGNDWEILNSNDVNNSGTELMKLLYLQTKNGQPTLKHLKYVNNTNPSEVFFNYYFDIHEVTTIKAGTLLGYFDTNNLGIDIVLGENKFTPTLQYVQQKEFSIKVSPPGTNFPGNESPNTLAKREYIHNFIDPVAYYSLHREIGVKYFDNGVKKKTDKVNLFTTIVSKFVNKNRVYIDIRNDNDYSLNYYNDNENSNYENILIELNVNDSTINSPIPSSYYSQYWPILIIENPTVLQNRNFASVYLEFFTTYNPHPSIYIDFGFSENVYFASENPNRILDFDFNINGQKFIDTNHKTLYFPAIESTGECVCWFSRIYYLRNELPQNTTLPSRVVPTFNPFDNVMGFITANGAGRYKYDYQTGANLTKTFWRLGLSKKFVPSGNGNPDPRMVQTGVGVSAKEIVFFAIDIDRSQMYSDLSVRSDKSKKLDLVNAGNSAFTEFKAAFSRSMNLKFVKTEFTTGEVALSLEQDYRHNKRSFPNQKFFYSIFLTRAEYSVIQQLVATHFDTSLHQVNLGWDLFNLHKDTDDNYYGSARLNLLGMDTNGNFKKINALKGAGDPPLPANQNLFINSSDSFCYSTIDAINNSSENLEIKKRENEEKAVYTIEKYIDLIKVVETAFPPPSNYNDPETQKEYIGKTIKRLRQYYYGSKSNRHGMVGKILLDLAIPSSPDASLYKEQVIWGGNSTHTEYYLAIDDSTFEKLFSHADENTIEDNPSPYVKVKNPLTCPNILNLNSCNDYQLIDIGHLLYGLEALIFNKMDTGWVFNVFQSFRSNDFAGYIADVFTAAAESRVYKNGKKNYFGEKFFYPVTNDLDRLYEISAPEADLLSDVDPFGVYNVYLYFIEALNATPSSEPKTLSFLLEYYFDKGYDPATSPILYPVEANFKKRWLNFCLAYDTVTTNDLNNLPEYYFSQYQGFAEFDPNTNKYLWKADDPLHISREVLRRRGEVFAHFWYQVLYLRNNKSSVFFNAINPWAIPNQLDTGEVDKPIRFERDFNIIGQESFKTLQSPLDEIARNFTDESELEYVMNKFLQWVKTNFLIEKGKWNY